MKREDINIRNIVLFIIGFVLLAFGITTSILSGIGADPWNSLFAHMAEIANLSVGTMIILIGILFLILGGALVGRRPRFEAIITNIAIGFAVDTCLLFIPVVDTMALQLLYYVSAIILVPVGVSFLIISKFPPTPIEILFLSFKEAIGLDYAKSRYLLDAIILLFAVITGLIAFGNLGSVNFGTIGFALTTGIILSTSLKIVNSLLKK
ncbi:hypothetical protein RJG79_01830 [Mycoplasmatota bacterium WC44]